MFTPTAHALAPNWNTAVDGNWSDTTKWSTTLVPVAGDTVTFNAAAQNGNETIYLDGNQAAATLTFANTGSTSLLGGVSGTPASSSLALGAVGAFTLSAGTGAVTVGDTAATPTAPVPVSIIAGANLINNSGSTLTIANRVTGGGAMNTAGGVITFTGAGTADAARTSGIAFKIGSAAGGGGVVNINGYFNATASGDTTIINGATLNWKAIGTVCNSGSSTTGIGGNAGTTNTVGTLNVTGGVLTLTPQAINTRAFNIGGTEQTSGTSTANGLLTVSGGTFIVGTNAAILLGSGYRDSVSGSGNGTLTIGGTNALFDTGTTTGLFRLGNKSAAVGTGTININTGGTLTTNRSITKGAGTGAVATVNFDGGTLKANGTAMNLNGLSAVNVKTAGATIDTNNFNLTLNHAFLNGIAGTDGGVAKRGAGSLAFNGTHIYTGPTSVTEGTLEIGGGGSINNSTGITVNGVDAKFIQSSTVEGTRPVTLTQGSFDGTGAVGAVTVANNANNLLANGKGTSARLSTGGLSFEGAATVNLLTSASTPTARIAVNGTLSTTPANGQVTINASGSWASGLNNLISYTTFSGSAADFTLGTIEGLTSRQTLGPLTLTANNLALTINGDSPKWTGRDSTEWIAAATGANSNWKLITSGAPTNYIDGDTVLFDDSATTAVTPGLVTISTADVTPILTTFNNSTTDYTLSGNFGIAGAGSLVKSGTAKTTIITPNTFTGTVTVNAGTLVVQENAALGLSAGATVASGAAIELQGGILANSVPLTLSGTGLAASPAGALHNVADANTYLGLLALGSHATIQADAGSTLTLSNTGLITGGGSNLTLDGAGAITIAGGIGTGSGAVVKNGSGTSTLSGTGSYTGGTTINAGILHASTDAALGAVPVEEAAGRRRTKEEPTLGSIQANIQPRRGCRGPRTSLSSPLLACSKKLFGRGTHHITENPTLNVSVSAPVSSCVLVPM